jgi:hypothetical protein
VLAQPIARPFDLDDDGVVKQSVEESPHASRPHGAMRST